MTTNQPSTSASTTDLDPGRLDPGRLDEAERAYRKQLVTDPADIASLIGLGDVLADTNRLKEAEEFYRKAIELQPDAAECAGAYDGLAAVLQDSGDLENAIVASKKAAVLRGNADDSFGVGNTLEFLGRITDAIEMFQLAASQKDDFGEAHAKAAKHLLTMGLAAEAIPHYQAATRAFPEVAELYCNLANAQQQVGDTDGALDSARRAIEIKPQLAEAHNIMGVLWKDRRRWADSLLAFNRALQVKPDAADALSNMGVVLELVGRESEATACFERAVAVRPGVQQYHVNLAGNLLLRGEYKRGWDELEWRRMDPSSPAARIFPQPMWDGSPLNGQTIFIHSEQPLNLAIQFLRYIKLTADRGGRVVFECQSALANLARQMDGVAEVIVQGEPLPPFDAHCPLFSLPKVFGTTTQTVPLNIPYIHIDPEKAAKWKKLVGSVGKGLRVGLAWADSVKPLTGRDRGCTMDRLIPLTSVPGIQLFNLQTLQTPLPSELKVVDIGLPPSDFNSMVGLIQQMDVVIGPDVPAADLAAAMGKKTFILLPSTPDWRWMSGSDDSLWYPSVKLFRQSSQNNWSAVIEQVKSALLK